MRNEIGAYIEQIQASIAYIQTRIENRQKAGFHEMEAIVEALVLNMFEALGIAKLQNMNQLKKNFPGIDLAEEPGDISLVDGNKNKNDRIAVQVTTNATSEKVKKTLAQYTKTDGTKPSLQDQYPTLYIVGFCKHANVKVPKNCMVVGPEYFIQQYLNKATLDKALALQNVIQRHVDYSSLHPWDDKSSLTIILYSLDRSAIRHSMACEGSITDMNKAFKEITELITMGTVNGSQRVKPSVHFRDEVMTKFLNDVKNHISDIQKIVFSRRVDGGDIYDLNLADRNKVDKIKEKIRKASNKVSKRYNLPILIK
ncbi:SMEK domain-containing protein [Methylophilus sp. 14]|uniref:SMEK domain-containing protein n=1 Tax=Methylophilus sp. 14 TaxID=2781019 RepID=UPI00188E8CCD|nr:SMEK domain-containing protein [Methylophilus sp. 14]MBF4989471.1 SMEK domain-containing protein [Methylophilus sp. 14]